MTHEYVQQYYMDGHTHTQRICLWINIISSTDQTSALNQIAVFPSQEPKGEYSKLDPQKPLEFEDDEVDEDPSPDIDDLEATDLIRFAYQIATGMVS